VTGGVVERQTGKGERGVGWEKREKKKHLVTFKKHFEQSLST